MGPPKFITSLDTEEPLVTSEGKSTRLLEELEAEAQPPSSKSPQSSVAQGVELHVPGVRDIREAQNDYIRKNENHPILVIQLISLEVKSSWTGNSRQLQLDLILKTPELSPTKGLRFSRKLPFDRKKPLEIRPKVSYTEYEILLNLVDHSSSIAHGYLRLADIPGLATENAKEVEVWLDSGKESFGFLKLAIRQYPAQHTG